MSDSPEFNVDLFAAALGEKIRKHELHYTQTAFDLVVGKAVQWEDGKAYQLQLATDEQQSWLTATDRLLSTLSRDSLTEEVRKAYDPWIDKYKNAIPQVEINRENGILKKSIFGASVIELNGLIANLKR